MLSTLTTAMTLQFANGQNFWFLNYKYGNWKERRVENLKDPGCRV